jgi:streptogramin lyase
MSLREFEAANLLLPLKNTDAMKAIACIAVDSTSRSVDLSTYFAQLAAGHFLTLIADGAKIYVALGENASGTIDDTATGTANTACVPIPDGSALHGVGPIGGRTVATGIATHVEFKHLKYKTPAGVSGFLRIYRSSLGPTQDAGEFKAP